MENAKKMNKMGSKKKDVFYKIKKKASDLKKDEVDKFLSIKERLQQFFGYYFSKNDAENFLNQLNAIPYDPDSLTERNIKRLEFFLIKSKT
jgi:hypothetical protein